jgi:predicted HD phosphohydrolase
VSVAEEVLSIYGRLGSGAYFGERVSMLEHGLQAAHFASVQSAPETLVIAALLHDVGHLLEAVPDEIEDWISDARHEEAGARWLAQRFAPAIAEPVRLHVLAKRYLCATDSHYFAQLSSASVHTLKLQGGPMVASEIEHFQAQAYHREALLLRRCDDQGKVAGLKTPALRDYAGRIDALADAR